MLCPGLIAALLLGPPAQEVVPAPAPPLPREVAAPLDAGVDAPPPASAPWLPAQGAAPLAVPDMGPPLPLPPTGAAPLHTPRYSPPPPPGSLPAWGVVPLDVDLEHRPAPPRVAVPFAPGRPLPVARVDPRTLRIVRLDVLVGPVWRVKTTELMGLVGVEVGRLKGFSGAAHLGVIVAPDRDFVAAFDVPLGGGVVYRHRFGERPIDLSVGLSAGLLIHRAATERGVVHRVDPDLQLPLRLAWTAGEVGFSVALVQGFSGRARTYSRRGAEVWHRVPYRVGFMVGIHFDVGVGRRPSRRAPRGARGP
ncbi:MAG: hypothetical protein JNL82_20755 [Myxococcales bacterium]|nr:hypothetical protein [Myxococcales bacterium]